MRFVMTISHNTQRGHQIEPDIAKIIQKYQTENMEVICEYLKRMNVSKMMSSTETKVYSNKSDYLWDISNHLSDYFERSSKIAVEEIKKNDITFHLYPFEVGPISQKTEENELDSSELRYQGNEGNHSRNLDMQSSKSSGKPSTSTGYRESNSFGLRNNTSTGLRKNQTTVPPPSIPRRQKDTRPITPTGYPQQIPNFSNRVNYKSTEKNVTEKFQLPNFEEKSDMVDQGKEKQDQYVLEFTYLPNKTKEVSKFLRTMANMFAGVKAFQEKKDNPQFTMTFYDEDMASLFLHKLNNFDFKEWTFVSTDLEIIRNSAYIYQTLHTN